MKKKLLLALVAVQGSIAFGTAKVDPALVSFGRGESVGTTKVIALMEDVLPPPTGIRKFDGNRVVAYLQAQTKKSFDRARESFQKMGAKPSDIKLIRLYMNNNSFAAQVTPAGLRQLAEAAGIKKIYANRDTQKEPYRKVAIDGRRWDGQEWPYDYKETKLDQLIAEHPEVTGQGVVLGHIDTGADGKHPALQGKILKFFDAGSRKVVEPTDSDEHGTHTAGTIVGGDRKNIKVGIAPGAKLISSGFLRPYDDMLNGLDIMIDPDGNPATNDRPRAVSNSWNSGGAPDQELFYKAVSALDAAGVVVVFSAGNAGPRPGSITPPHEHPLVIAVANTEESGKIANSSSRGPVKFHDQPTEKPTLSAPGTNIVSSIPGGKYEAFTGTSMACPHVAGAIGLILQVNPALNPEQIKQLLVRTADPVDENGKPGAPGKWNANYGFGKLNIYKAVTSARAVLEGRRPFGFDSGMFSLENHSMLEDKPAYMEASALSFPADLEGTSWLTPAQIWN